MQIGVLVDRVKKKVAHEACVTHSEVYIAQIAAWQLVRFLEMIDSQPALLFLGEWLCTVTK